MGHGDVYSRVREHTVCDGPMKAAVEQVIELAVEIAREGREGRKIGTLLTVGDVEGVLAHSRPLILDPLYGHPREVMSVELPEFRETVKELAQLDGAFVVDADGTFVSAGRYLHVDLTPEVTFIGGLGTRHAAAASISATTRAVAIAVSQSSVVRVFARGELRAEIIPELFLLSRQRLFARGAEPEIVPEAGLTLALAE
jgi:diadenylate cyclase